VTTEPLNLRHCDDITRGVYEVWYLTFNHPGTGQGFWLRFVTEAPTEATGHGPRAEIWFARFDRRDASRTFGFHRRFPWATFESHRDPFAIAIANNRLAHDHTSGKVSGDGHTVEWDLRWEPAQRELRMYPALAYTAKIGPTTAYTPNPRVPLSGTIVVDGEQLDFDRAVAGQTHLYGKKHAFAWTWAHCAELTGAPGALLELISARIQRGGRTLPPLTMVVLDLDGERHELNQFRHVAMNRASWKTGHVKFLARSATVKVEGELLARPEEMITAPYVDPDGTRVFCANTEIGDVRLTVWKRKGLGWREHRRLESIGRAHFEVGGRERDPAVAREHVTVE
jgi:hypothetical protein